MSLKDTKAMSTREMLLGAAKRVVARLGVKRLTLDMVALEANVSKGGVLYHFPTMNALIVAMMETDLERWHNKMDAFQETEAERGDKPEAGRFVRAMICSLACPMGETPEGAPADAIPHDVSPEVRSGMFAAVAGDRELLQRLRDEFLQVQSRVESDGLDPVMATLIRLAADGLLFTDMLGLAAPQGEFRRQIADKLLELATPAKNSG